MCSVGAVAPLAMNMFGAMSQSRQQAQQSEYVYQQQLAAYQRDQMNWEITKRKADDELTARREQAHFQMQQLQHAQVEVNDAAAVEAFEAVRDMQKAKAMTMLTAVEAGAGGRTAEKLQRAVAFEQTNALNNIEQNRSNQINDLQLQKLSVVQSQKVAPLYSVDSGPPQRMETNSGWNFMNAIVGGIGGLGNLGSLDMGNSLAASSGATCLQTAQYTTPAPMNISTPSPTIPVTGSNWNYSLTGPIAGGSYTAPNTQIMNTQRVYF